MCRVSAARKPRVASNPVYRDSSANAAGIMVSAIIARIAPAARAWTADRAAGGAPSSSAKPASEASPEASAIAPQIPKTYRRLRPARFQPALLESPSGTLEMNTAANIGTLSPGPARTHDAGDHGLGDLHPPCDRAAQQQRATGHEPGQQGEHPRCHVTSSTSVMGGG